MCFLHNNKCIHANSLDKDSWSKPFLNQDYQLCLQSFSDFREKFECEDFQATVRQDLQYDQQRTAPAKFIAGFYLGAPAFEVRIIHRQYY